MCQDGVCNAVAESGWVETAQLDVEACCAGNGATGPAVWKRLHKEKLRAAAAVSSHLLEGREAGRPPVNQSLTEAGAFIATLPGFLIVAKDFRICAAKKTWENGAE